MRSRNCKLGQALFVGLTIILSGTPLRASDTCPNLTQEEKNRFIDLVRSQAGISGELTVSVEETVAGTCYQKLRFRSSASSDRFSLAMYVAPDHRMLMHEIFDASHPPDASRREQEKQLDLDLQSGNHAAQGQPAAPVTVTVFSDFQCPYCKQQADVLMKSVLPEEQSRVRVIFRHFPLPRHV